MEICFSKLNNVILHIIYKNTFCQLQLSRESLNCLLFGVFLLQHLPVLCVYLFVCFHHCLPLLWAFCLILPLPHKTAPDGPIVPPGWIKFLFDVHLNPFPFFLPPFWVYPRVSCTLDTPHPFTKRTQGCSLRSKAEWTDAHRPRRPPPPTHPPPPLNPSVAKPRCQTNARYKRTHTRTRGRCAHVRPRGGGD